MMYIPSDWIINPQNTEKIHSLAEKCFPSDVVGNMEEKESEFAKKLREMGETKLLKYFEDGKLIIS